MSSEGAFAYRILAVRFILPWTRCRDKYKLPKQLTDLPERLIVVVIEPIPDEFRIRNQVPSIRVGSRLDSLYRRGLKLKVYLLNVFFLK